MQKKMKGWIKLHRTLRNWEWYDDINATRLLVHLIISVNYEAKKWKGIDIKSGSMVLSWGSLSNACGLSVQQCRTSMTKLKNSKEVTIKSTNKYQVVTLVKWEQMQGLDVEVNKQPNNQVTGNQQTNNKQVTTTKEYNNKRSKEIKKTIIDRKADFKKSLSEFSFQNIDEANKFFSYWTEHGENDRKMRFEKEKSFSLKSRWSRWLKNSEKWNKEKSSAKKEDAATILQRQMGIIE